MKTDLEIAQASKMRPIHLVAKALGIDQRYLEAYGAYKAKIKPFPFANESKPSGKVILVTAITPTPAGEGKSTTTIGLGDALNRLGKKAMICLREPSLGPVMGVKGGAAGGGYAQVVPMEDINLHFTGDIHAITSANNLISAVIDNHLYHGNALSLDVERIVWKRAMDMNDRALRMIEVGRSSKKETPRPDGFDISVASEIMAVLCLSQNMDDLKQRLARMVVGYNLDSQPITAKDLNVHGAVAMLLKDALKPNLVQTLEHTPVFIHGGPFANIAHGCNSVIATELATRLTDYVVTEAGFGADLGMEKFIHIKAPVLGKMPSAVVLVASIRALKMHGGLSKANIKDESIEALKAGIVNLEKHIENIRAFDLPFVVALNHFGSDSDAEVEWMLKWAQDNQVPMALSDVFAKGSKGGVHLAQKVLGIIEGNPDCQGKQLYKREASIEEKVTTIARKLYGASHVTFSDQAQAFILEASRQGWDTLAICMAKTPLSLSDNPKLLGRPRDFTVTVRDFKPSIGAGFIVALTGEVMTMPGLPKIGAFENMDVIDDKIIGLF